jgi:hypothetical protein
MVPGTQCYLATRAGDRSFFKTRAKAYRTSRRKEKVRPRMYSEAELLKSRSRFLHREQRVSVCVYAATLLSAAIPFAEKEEI